MHLNKLDNNKLDNIKLDNTKLDNTKLDNRGVTLQVVIITAILTLAGAIFSVVLWRIFGTQTESVPGERVQSTTTNTLVIELFHSHTS